MRGGRTKLSRDGKIENSPPGPQDYGGHYSPCRTLSLRDILTVSVHPGSFTSEGNRLETQISVHTGRGRGHEETQNEDARRCYLYTWTRSWSSSRPSGDSRPSSDTRGPRLCPPHSGPGNTRTLALEHTHTHTPTSHSTGYYQYWCWLN